MRRKRRSRTSCYTRAPDLGQPRAARYPPDVSAFSRFFADLESSAGIFREMVCSPDADRAHFAGRIVPPVGFAKLVSGRHLKSD